MYVYAKWLGYAVQEDKKYPVNHTFDVHLLTIRPLWARISGGSVLLGRASGTRVRRFIWREPGNDEWKTYRFPLELDEHLARMAEASKTMHNIDDLKAVGDPVIIQKHPRIYIAAADEPSAAEAAYKEKYRTLRYPTFKPQWAELEALTRKRS